MKIGIYGGTFDPIHKGHINVAYEMINLLNLDKLIFVPAFQNPFKKTGGVDGTHRINMINLVLPEKCEVSDFEINRKGVSYTIDTIKYFKSKFPNDEIFLIIGSDNATKLSKWKDIDTLSQLCKIAIYPREKSFNKEQAKKYNCLIIKTNKIFADSSTSYRNGDITFVDEKVQDYIGTNNLYLDDMLLASLDALTHKHSYEVAKLAAVYAKQLGVDSKRAYIAGSLHDIAKRSDVEEMRQVLVTKGVPCTWMNDKILHGPYGALWLQDIYKMKDKEIIDAVYNHSVAKIGATKLDKIIFMADKLCEGRKFPNIQEYRKVALENFDEGFSKLAKYLIGMFDEKNTQLTTEQKEALEYYAQGGK